MRLGARGLRPKAGAGASSQDQSPKPNWVLPSHRNQEVLVRDNVPTLDI